MNETVEHLGPAVLHNAAAKRHGDTFRASWQAVCYGCGWRGRHTTQAGAAREAAEHNDGATT